MFALKAASQIYHPNKRERKVLEGHVRGVGNMWCHRHSASGHSYCLCVTVCESKLHSFRRPQESTGLLQSRPAAGWKLESCCPVLVCWREEQHSINKVSVLSLIISCYYFLWFLLISLFGTTLWLYLNSGLASSSPRWLTSTQALFASVDCALAPASSQNQMGRSPVFRVFSSCFTTLLLANPGDSSGYIYILVIFLIMSA